MEKIGNVCEIQRVIQVEFEWRIKDFFLLSHIADIRYSSPEFHFSGSSWEIQICPYTLSSDKNYIHLYIYRKSGNVTVDYSLSLKTVDGKRGLDATQFTSAFREENRGCEYMGFIHRSELIKRNSELLPSGVLTVICRLKKSGKNNTDGVCKLQHYLKGILENGNISDVVLKVADEEFKSHRCILARSPVFLAMMTHETKEKNSGVVDIPDVDPNVFSCFLNYLYTGSMDNVTVQDVVELYIAADKYQVDDLKESCVYFMLKNISVDNFCDFLFLSLQYVEKDLTDACSQFFNKNAFAIVVTSKWQLFISESPKATNELLINLLKPNAEK